MREDLRPHVEDEPLTNPRRDPPLAEREGRIEDREHPEEQRELDDQAGVVGQDAVVDDRRVDQRVRGSDRGVDHDQHKEHEQQPPVGRGEDDATRDRT